MPDLEKAREAITERLAALQHRMEAIEADLDTPKEKDLEDQAVDLEDDEVLEGVGRAAQLETRLLQAALERIEDGTYGECIGCGTTISDARLAAVPYAVLCRDCAAKGEA